MKAVKQPRQPELIRGMHNLRPEHRGCVVTIGSFDGIHRGHQAILRQVVGKAKTLGLPSVVVVFEPQPMEFFLQQRAPARLMSLREKAQALFAAGVDRVLCLYFNDALRLLSAEDFVNRVIVAGLAPRYVLVGDDFRFGHGRSGDFELLQQTGVIHGFAVAKIQTYKMDGQCLEVGDFAGATRLLGKPYSISGRVGYGQQLGRQMGVPTINVLLHRCCSPLQGVFVVEIDVEIDVEVDNDVTSQSVKSYQGVANIGVRPTVSCKEEPVLEVHLLDVNQSLYGSRVKVTFLKKLRHEQKFASLAQLKAQIDQDIKQARDFF